MGRKGVSKRKPHQTKAQPFSKDKASSGSSAAQAAEPQPVKAFDAGKADPTTNRKKTSRKG